MPDLKEVLSVRRDLVARRDLLAQQSSALEEVTGRLTTTRAHQNWLATVANPGPELQVRDFQISALTAREAELQQSVRAAEEALASATANHEALLEAQPPLWSSSAGEFPVALFPVRIETRFASAPSGVDLRIRIYPDDVLVDSLTRGLTERERDAGRAYWQKLWSTIGTRDDLVARVPVAWAEIQRQLTPLRAAWAVRETTPSNLPPNWLQATERPSGAPAFERAAGRSGSSRPHARVRLLPETWTAYGFANGELLFQATSKPIPEALSLDIFARPDRTAAAAAETDPSKRWPFDFAAAVDVGMAVSVHLDERPAAIDQIFAVGAAAQLEPETAATQLEDLFLGHAYRTGLGFLAPGTPTNNTVEGPSVWTGSEHVPLPTAILERSASFSMEHPTTNAALIASALGIDGRPALAWPEDALADWQSAPRTMIDALFAALAVDYFQTWWSVFKMGDDGSSTLGVDETLVDPTVLEAWHVHATEHVRGRGPLPCLRIGRQPYGVLPVCAHDLWRDDNDPVESVIGRVLVHIRPFWTAALLNVPHTHSAQDQDQSVLDVLARVPVSMRVVLRSILWTGLNLRDAVEPIAIVPDVPWTRGLFLTLLDTTTKPLPEDLPLVGDSAALARRWTALRDMIRQSLEHTPQSDLLKTIHATYLTEGVTEMTPEAQAEMRKGANLLNALYRYARGRDQTMMFLYGNVQSPEEFGARLKQLWLRDADWLDRLAGIPGDQYEPLLLETLDIFSHRIDAWATSLATKRLRAMRAAHPRGCHVGIYGWTEHLVPADPAPPAEPAVPGFEGAVARPSDTFVLAPSLQHAATAAVLRAGFDSHKDPSAFAVNVTSRRARIARWILDGVRQGQTLGALLGYRFERALHDRKQDVLIERFRKLFPIPLLPDPEIEQTDTPAREAIAAQNVVDGLALHRGVATVPADLRQQTQDLLDDLADAVDAVGDLLLAESVHHLVAGNPLRAGLAADMLGRGEAVPDRFDMLRTPRSGRIVSYLAGVLLPARGGHEPVDGWARRRPRSSMASQLELWVQRLLGPAARWQIPCDVGAPGAVQRVSVSLDALSICALDAVMESGTSATNGVSLLERRLRRHARGTRPPETPVLVAQDPVDGRAWRTLRALCERTRSTLIASSPLMPAHLDALDSTPSQRIDKGEFATRCNKFLEQLLTATTTLQTAANALAGNANDAGAQREVRSALEGIASFGLELAFPADADGVPLAGPELAERAQMVASALAAMNLPSTIGAPNLQRGEAGFRGWFDQVVESLHKVLGLGFPVCPIFRPAPEGEFVAAKRPARLEDDRPAGWLRDVGRVREKVRRFNDLMTLRDTFGLDTPRPLIVLQAPAAEGESWVALPMDQQHQSAAQRSWVLDGEPSTRAQEGICGLVVDTWTEQLPTRDQETAALTFHFNKPDAVAPQAILIAVPPRPGKPWTEDTLLQTVRETLDMGKLRAVDHRDLPHLTPLAPVIYNLFNDSIAGWETYLPR